jgi:hypothetical protein
LVLVRIALVGSVAFPEKKKMPAWDVLLAVLVVAVVVVETMVVVGDGAGE